MHIEEYLVQVAENITSHAPGELPLPEKWEAWRAQRQREYLEAMGLSDRLEEPRESPNVRTARILDREDYTVECLAFESAPGMWVAGNLYVPKGEGKFPAIVYVCGHSAPQKAADQFQQHGRRYAKLGFVCFVLDTVQLGEVRGYHHGPYQYGWFHWYSRGYTPAAAEAWNGIRAIDLLISRPEVHPESIGVSGISGGGASTWWIACADDRIKAASPSCGTGTIASLIRERTLDDHCDCMFPMNPQGKSLVEAAAIVAPRPLLIVSAARDGLYDVQSIENFYERSRRIYSHLGAAQNIGLVTYPAPHSNHPDGRRKTFQFFLRHLAGKDVSLADVPDIDDHLEKTEDLSVFGDGLPANDRSTSVHDWLTPRPQTPKIETATKLKQVRQTVVDRLRSETFATFPNPLPHPDVRVDLESWFRGDRRRILFRYTAEEGWRLKGTLFQNKASLPSPTIVELLGRDSLDLHHMREVVPLSEGAPTTWGRAALSIRGTGETGWHDSLQWHLRRAMPLTGRTIASLRVLDTLQGLRSIRQLEGVDAHNLYLAGSGEMAVVALYSALLDGNVRGVILYDPPGTQDAPSSPDGRGAVVEMLNVLRIVDLPQVAGLLWPMHIVFVGYRPESYLWTEDLYSRLGKPGGVWRVPQLQNWRPLTAEAQPAQEKVS